MKLNVVRAKVLSASSGSDLENELNDFLAAKGSHAGESPEREFVHVQLEVNGTTWAALVLYTE